MAQGDMETPINVLWSNQCNSSMGIYKLINGTGPICIWDLIQ